MKNLIIFLGCAFTIFSTSAAEIYNKNGNKLNLYGKIDGLHYFSDDEASRGDKSYFRTGLSGVTQINDQLTGYGKWEYNILANQAEDSGDNAWTRLAYAGLKHSTWGSIDYGRNYGILYDVESYTDMLPEFGGDSYTQSDVFMTGRTQGVATYRNKDFFGLLEGLNFGLQYQGKNTPAASDEPSSVSTLARQHGDGYGGSLSYDTDMGLSIATAVASSDRTGEQKSAIRNNRQFASGDKARAWATGLKYDAHGVYLGAMYAETRNMTAYGSGGSIAGGGIAGNTRNTELTAQYQFDSGLRPALSYIASLAEKLHSPWGDNKYLVKYIDISMTYNLNKNISAYLDYKINLLDAGDDFYADNGIATDNIAALGLVYQF
ncbi:porin [Salmonella enterica subsp. enterica serovar Saintpaul]|nr:porin [Salmonella enterica subsp. enterica serovar Saintpaul]